MTFHASSGRTVKGHRPNRTQGHNTSPRLAFSLGGKTLEALSKSAAEHGVPAAQLVREAIEQYLIAQGTLSEKKP